MPIPPSLLELQHRLESLLSLGGSADGARQLADAAPGLPIVGDDRLGAAERLDVYASAIFIRIRDAIAEDYPATHAALGPEDWGAQIARYVEAHPTDHPDLRMAGRHLPDFLRACGPAWVADLADLERSLAEAFTAANAAPLRTESVQALEPGAWPDLWVRAVPSLRVLLPTTPSDEIRRRLLDGKPAAPDEGHCAPIRVWRRDLRVFQRRIEPLEERALRLLVAGVTFADLCDWIDEQDGERYASEIAVGLLTRWLGDELLAAEA